MNQRLSGREEIGKPVRRGYKGAGGNIWGNRCVHYFDSGDDFRVCIYAKTYQNICFKYMYFIVCQLYLNKVVFKSSLHTFQSYTYGV